MTNVEEKTNHAKDNAQAGLASIIEMVADLATMDVTDKEHEEASQRIQEDPLEITVRTDWHAPGAKDSEKPTEYNILLTTGGPALRLIGDLDQYCQPETAKLQYQDWFTSWTDYTETTDEEDSALLTYARQFYFGE